MRSYVAACGLLLSLAVDSAVFASGSVTFTITNITYSEGNAYASVAYNLTQGSPNPDGCNASTYFLVAYTSSNLPSRESVMQAALLTAEVSGRPVQALLSGCAAGLGGATYPLVYYLTQ